MSRTAEALGGRGDRWHSAHCVELGAAVLVDSLDEFDASGDEISSDSATQSALLLGAAFGWDFLQGEHLSLGLDARGSATAGERCGAVSRRDGEAPDFMRS